MEEYSESILAVENADWSSVFEQLDRGIPFDQLHSHSGLSALGRAVVDRNGSIVEQLLAKGASPDPFLMRNKTWYSPLWAALERGYEDIAIILIRAGAKPDDQKDYGDSPICFASQQRMASATCELCSHGANPNPNSKISPLLTWIGNIAHDISELDDASLVSLSTIFCLLDAGADPDARDSAGLNAPMLARRMWWPLEDSDSFPKGAMAVSAMEGAIINNSCKTPSEHTIPKRI